MEIVVREDKIRGAQVMKRTDKERRAEGGGRRSEVGACTAAWEQADLKGREKRGEEGERGLAGGTHKRMVPLKRRKHRTYIARHRERRHGHEDSQGIYSAGAGIEHAVKCKPVALNGNSRPGRGIR
jgi:hypothetical protein